MVFFILGFWQFGLRLELSLFLLLLYHKEKSGFRGRDKNSDEIKLGALDTFSFSSENCRGINTALTVYSAF